VYITINGIDVWSGESDHGPAGSVTGREKRGKMRVSGGNVMKTYLKYAIQEKEDAP